MNTPNFRLAPPALPATSAALLTFRKAPPKASLNDLVEQIHLRLWDEDGYQAYWLAVYNDQAVEGSLVADTHEAARMVRDFARDHIDDNGFFALIASEKLSTIMKSLGVVAKRYGISRAERRNRVSGVDVDVDALASELGA